MAQGRQIETLPWPYCRTHLKKEVDLKRFVRKQEPSHTVDQELIVSRLGGSVILWLVTNSWCTAIGLCCANDPGQEIASMMLTQTKPGEISNGALPWGKVMNLYTQEMSDWMDGWEN